ncbi:YIP1 family protein [Sulfitobacter aestuariivivens]|uniref:YIP1 family protein n=1 Tax=Sulfitobacter aestuariivivens TaxID=2766981 RepID=A0A927HDW9_9RHOB|nr:YIP1 family protein [Sulfitobacter aestuariivivens]MBD3663281.1 YIP1 family protein [Sulfitobacter aestuariivivens]
MTPQDIIDLAKLTFRDPAAAGKAILALGFSRDVLWTALALVAAFNAVFLQLLMATAGPDQQLPSYFSTPLAAFVLIAGMMVIYIHALYWAGMAMGGNGRLIDLLALVVWLQVLRTGLQLVIILLSVFSPTLAALATLVVFAWGVWVLLTFLMTALNLTSYGHALVVVVVGLIGLVLGLGILLAFIGVLAQGTQANV